MLAKSEREQIRSVIEQQLAAFQRDDAAIAFSFASPGIQEQFQTADLFMAMVKTSYRAVYRPRSVLFENLMQVEHYPAQVVLLMQQDGQVVRAVYVMQQQEDHTWRIHGCFLTNVQP